MATLELYRVSTIGECLMKAVHEMFCDGKLEFELAEKVVLQFDKSMSEALETQVKSKVSIKGHVHTYRICDDCL